MSADRWILEAYERADEQARADMYMLYRDLRDEFAEIEAANVSARKNEVSVAKAEPLKVRWNIYGRYMKARNSV